jgi:uncharacterized protein (DUF1015 family)
MRISPFQAIYPNFDYITSPDSFFGTVKQDFREYYDSGFFHRSGGEGFYIYQIRNARRTHTGLLACMDIRDFLEGRLKKHEHTLPAKEQRQMHLLLHRRAMVKPVLATYPDVPEIKAVFEAYEKEHAPFFTAQFEESEEEHVFWEVSEKEAIEQIRDLFREKVPGAYIADGHHRTSCTALLYQRRQGKGDDHKFSRLLCAFFPVHELEVFDYNRVVEGLEDISLTTFMAKISQLFHIQVLEEGRKPLHKHEIIMLLNHEWFQLKWKQSILDLHQDEPVVLDASLLDEHVLGEILGMEDVRTDDRIKYVEGIAGLSGFRSGVLRNEHNVGFLLYPVYLDDMILVSDKQQVMPPKSTWFEPRMKNGLIVHELKS